jgi:hypothetical protein
MGAYEGMLDLPWPWRATIMVFAAIADEVRSGER